MSHLLKKDNKNTILSRNQSQEKRSTIQEIMKQNYAYQEKLKKESQDYPKF